MSDGALIQKRISPRAWPPVIELLTRLTSERREEIRDLKPAPCHRRQRALLRQRSSHHPTRERQPLSQSRRDDPYGRAEPAKQARPSAVSPALDPERGRRPL